MGYELSEEEFRKRYPALWQRRDKYRRSLKKNQKPRKLTRIEKAVATREYHRFEAPRHGRLWIAEEDRYLRNHWGTFSLNVMSRDLERSGRAVYERVRSLGLRIERDDTSLTAFAAYAGFDRSKVKNACKALGLKLRRGRRVRKWERSRSRAAASSAKNNRWFVPLDIQEELLAFLLEHAESRIQIPRDPKPSTG